MKKYTLLILIVLLSNTTTVFTQITSQSNFLVAQPVADRSISFSVSDTGVYKPIIWGLDLAWCNEGNLRRGLAFMGTDRVDVVRSSFVPTDPVVNRVLTGNSLTSTNERIRLINKWLGSNTQVVLNSDHPSVNSWYSGNAENWGTLIDVTLAMHQASGRTVITVSPFNEPDYSATGQGTMLDFYNICGVLKNNPNFNNIMLSGGNTLNPDVALEWYNYLKARLNVGNTHQLAGSFNNYAAFFQAVRANGHHATNDELHNVMEAMVGVEYGMQTGIWWGTAELARGEFCKASDGRRLGYAEHRPNWTAASVYRHTDGRIQAFGGGSERQSVTTTYQYISKDRDVYYDGHGPQREFVLELPGGAPNTYQTTLHCSPERVINITWGSDIQPVINGRYKLVNRKSEKVMEILNDNIRQNTYKGSTLQQWNVTPVDSRIGGDFSYFKIANVYNGLCPDVLNFSLENGANIIAYSFIGTNQQWYLEYAQDGWFYIRSKLSNKCLEVANSSILAGANIQQWEKTGGENQQWRFIPIDADVEFVAPAAPSNLTVTNQLASVRLDWDAGTETDIAGYTIFRADSANGLYNTIARNVKTRSFVDNTTIAGNQYFYAVKAVDKSLNSSGYSAQVTTTAPNGKDLLANLKFENTMLDSTINLNHSAYFGTATYTEGKKGNAVSLNGTGNFVQLPPTIANANEITIAAWVYLRGINYTQHIFSFGNGQNEYMYFNPRFNATKSRFAIKNGGVEQSVVAPALPLLTWTHLVVSMDQNGVRVYMNGKQVATSTTVTIKPLDFKPALNYIGRSQNSADALLNANIDEFRVYNYALSANEVEQIAGIVSGDNSGVDFSSNFKVWPSPANNVIYITSIAGESNKASEISIYKPDGKVILTRKTTEKNIELNTSGFAPGIYFIKLTSDFDIHVQKIVVKH